jgi:hypothetical protein
MQGPCHSVSVRFGCNCVYVCLTQRKNKIVTRQTGNSASRIVSSDALVTWSSRVRKECFRNMVFFFFDGSISAMIVLEGKCS